MDEQVSKYILITGVAGLLGSNMADWIIRNKKEYGVIGVDDLSGGYVDNIHKEVIFFDRDLTTTSLDDIFSKYNIEYVYHFAAYAAEGLSPFMRMFNYQENCIATANVINCCINHSVKRLVFTSSMAVYGHGNMQRNRFDENDEPRPIDPYGVAKYACEMDIKIAGEQHGLDWCIIRPHNIYGEKQNIWDRYRNVLGIWMYQTLHDMPMLIYGDGEQTRAFTYVGDNMQPLWNAAVSEKASKQIINLGGITEYTIKEAADILSQITGYNKIEFREPRHEVKWAVPTYEKSIEKLNFQDNCPLKEGLEKMWDWAQAQPEKQRKIWDRYEIEKGIYGYWL